MSGCLDENALAAYVERVMPPAERALAERHLDACENCRELLALLARTEPAPGAAAAAKDDPSVTLSGARSALLAKGAQVGRYLVLEPVGTGAMGIVYAAYDPALDRKVALKLLHPSAATAQDPAEAMQRLLREAQAIARLSHPNVVTVFEFGAFGDGVFLAMEFVEGDTLREWAQAQRPWQEVVRYYLYAGRGLSAAHKAGLVHRDFKPANVLVGKDGRIRVADFGLVRTDGLPPAGAEAKHISGDSPLRTQNGAIVGTPAYMAPEQLQGASVDARADQFAFCVALYEALYGTRPFTGSLGEALKKMERHELAPPKTQRGPARLRRILSRGLSFRAEDRFPTMDALLAELQPVLGRGRLRLGAELGALLAVAVLAGVLWTRPAAAPVCADSQETLAATWSPQVADSLMSGVPADAPEDARESLKRLFQILDRHGNAWVKAHHDACVATKLEHAQPESVLTLRMACLDRRRREMAALVQAVKEARPELLERAPELARVLRPVEECDAQQVVAREAVTVPPPDAAAKVLAVRDELARLEALRFLNPDGVDAAAAQAAEHARKAGYAPVEAEAQVALGLVQLDQRRYAEAERTLLRAVHMADQASHDEMRLRAELNLADLLGMRQRRFAEADAHVDAAAAILERMGRPVALEADFSIARGLVEFQQRKYAEAEALFRRSLALREGLYGPDDPRTLLALVDLAQALKGRGAFREAAEVAKRARDVLRSTVGPRHTLTITAEVSLGSVLYRLGDAKGALETFRAANLPAVPATPRDASTRVRLVDTLVRLGDLEEAAARLEEVKKWVRDNADPTDPLSSSCNLAEARLDEARGRIAEALALYDTEIAKNDAAYGPQSGASANLRIEKARLWLKQGKTRPALQLLDGALQAELNDLDASHPTIAMVRALRGEARAAAGDNAGAEEDLQWALNLQQKSEPDPLLVARTRVALAEVLCADPGQEGRVRALLQSAEAALQERAPPAAELRERWQRVNAKLP